MIGKSNDRMSWPWRSLLLCAMTAAVSAGQTFTPLFSFDEDNGASPMYVALVQGFDGNFYGTTYEGGSTTCTFGCGTVFRITPAGILTTLHKFNVADGRGPEAGLVLTKQGNFYGTTVAGGANNLGTIFEITQDGKLTTLYSFNSAEGATPYCALVETRDGIYGTTFTGGPEGLGSIFKYTAAGGFQNLHSFTSTGGPAQPIAGLLLGADGDLYGTSPFGGYRLRGTVYKTTAAGVVTTLYRFGVVSGNQPYAGLVQGPNGNFYGATQYEGPMGKQGNGTLFELTPAGSPTTLVVFDGTNGTDAAGAMILATDGNFYGTTGHGGANGWGTLFQLTPTGGFTTLHSLAETEGSTPVGSLLQATNGDFYGTAAYMGENNWGSIFRL